MWFAKDMSDTYIYIYIHAIYIYLYTYMLITNIPYYIIVDIHCIELRSLPKFSPARPVRRSQRCCRGEISTSGRISEVPRFQSYVFSADPGVD